MKEITHYVFSIGTSMYILMVLGLLSGMSILSVVWLSFCINYIIDALGHTMLGAPARTRVTHSVFTAPLWGALVAGTSFELLSRLFEGFSQLPTLQFWVTAGILISMGHLFLDSMTQAGVYYWSRRIAIAHFRYDNLFINLGFVSLGVLLLVFSLADVNLMVDLPAIFLSLS